MTGVLAAVLTGAAGWLACGPPVSSAAPRRRWRWWGLVAVVPGLLLVPPGRVVPTLLVLGGVLGVLRIRELRRRAADARDRAGSIQEACAAMAVELAAGSAPGRALATAASVAPDLRSVVAAHELGGSVPDALRRQARLPGGADLALVAATWQVAHRSGAGLADGLGAVADAVRERQALRALVASELASARATARLVVALPVLTLVLGSGIGGEPLAFLLGSPGGWACLAGGLGLGLAGLAWIEGIAGAVEEEAG